MGVVGHVRIRSATPCETDGPRDYIFLISSKLVVPKRSNDVGSKKIPLQRDHHIKLMEQQLDNLTRARDASILNLLAFSLIFVTSSGRPFQVFPLHVIVIKVFLIRSFFDVNSLGPNFINSLFDHFIGSTTSLLSGSLGFIDPGIHVKWMTQKVK